MSRRICTAWQASVCAIRLPSRSNGVIGSHVWSNRFTVGSGWGTAVQVSLGNAGAKNKDAQLAIDGAGNAFMVWLSDDSLTKGIYAGRYTRAGGWEAPVNIDSLSGATHDPQIAFDLDGNALAVWTQAGVVSSTVTRSAYASRYTAGGGWATAQRISQGNAFYPKIAIDRSGHALAAWSEQDSALNYSLWANRYTNGSGWTSSEQISQNGSLFTTGDHRSRSTPAAMA